jgi:gamma-glutamylcyclotransferase (GGCT)/AIG2-like uncharacterized protein YtfP
MAAKTVIVPSDEKFGRHLLFVYGTLKKEGGTNAHERYLSKATYVGKCSVKGVMLHLSGYPGMVPDNVCRVTGEIYEVQPSDIQNMDRYEGVPHNFVRRLTDTPFGTAWAYYKTYNAISLAENVVCVDRGVWTGRGAEDRVPYRQVKDFWANKRYHEPEERAKPMQPVTYDVIPESSPARGPVALVVPPKPALPPVIKFKPVQIGPGVEMM